MSCDTTPRSRPTLRPSLIVMLVLSSLTAQHAFRQQPHLHVNELPIIEKGDLDVKKCSGVVIRVHTRTINVDFSDIHVMYVYVRHVLLRRSDRRLPVVCRVQTWRQGFDSSASSLATAVGYCPIISSLLPLPHFRTHLIPIQQDLHLHLLFMYIYSLHEN